jgi:peptidoglycan/LPS O-acetylase OafA/YrhL
MITGFLFWGRVLRSEGRLDAPRLYQSRLRRLAPMYLASVVLSLGVVAAVSGFALHESLGRLAHEVRPWFSFGFMSTGEVNGVADAHHINAVYWTLAFEWGFYIALPFLAVFARGPAGMALFLVAVAFGTSTPILLNFVGGALVAVLAYHRRLPAALASPALSVVPIAALAAVYALGLDHPLADTTLLTVFFAFVAGGNSLFGLLSSRPAKLLGTVSYSIYLLHSIVLFCVLTWIDARTPIAAMPAFEYWVLIGAAAIGTVLASALTYRWCEHPFLKPFSRAGQAPKPNYADGLPRAKPATLL